MAFSDSKELQRQEQGYGFKERPPKTESFFRGVNCGTWRQKLAPEQAVCLIREHREVMERFGYLNANGEPVF